MSVFKKEFYTKKRLILFLLTFAGGLFIYSLLMSERLVNDYDGLWNGFYFGAGQWEVSCGRFVWPYLCKARAHLSQDPYTSVISLFVISGSLLVVDALMDVEKTLHAFILNLMFLANAVVCVFLSYRFMSPTFAFSVFFSVFAVACLVNLCRPLNIFAAGVCLMLSMGLYQASIGCACVLIIGVFVLWILQKKETKEIGRFLADGVLAAVVGGVLYVVFLKLSLMLYHTEMSTYHGGSGYSLLGAVKHFPSSVLRTYDQFVQYFFKNQFLLTVFQKFHSQQLLSVAFSIILLCCIVLWVLRFKWRGMIAALVLFLMPMASSVILFIVTDGENSIQMTAPMALVLPVLFALAMFTVRLIERKKFRNLAVVGVLSVSCTFAYTEALQVCMDQSEMLEGTRSLTWMYNSTIEDLKDENLISKDSTYLYYGNPAENPYFWKSDIYELSNTYAKVGNFWWAMDTNALDWKGVKENLGGIDIKLAEFVDYQQMRENEDLLGKIRNMPVFPEKGYIQKFGDLVIIKTSLSE